MGTEMQAREVLEIEQMLEDVSDALFLATTTDEVHAIRELRLALTRVIDARRRAKREDQRERFERLREAR